MDTLWYVKRAVSTACLLEFWKVLLEDKILFGGTSHTYSSKLRIHLGKEHSHVSMNHYAM